MNSRIYKIAITLGITSFLVVIFMFSPLFYLQEVIISGNNAVDAIEIRERLEVGNTTNLLLFRANDAASRLLENLYISEVSFTRRMPGRLYVHVRERRLAAYIEHMPGSFLYIDENGRVLEVRPFTSGTLPMVTGLNFSSFTLGEILYVPDHTAFSIVTHYAQFIYRHGLSDRVSYIDVSDTLNTRILIGYVEFNVGGLRDAEEKIGIINGIMNEMPEADRARGFVDLRDISGEFFFEILT